MSEAADRRKRVDRWAIAAVIGLAVVVGVVACVAGSIRGSDSSNDDLESISQCETRIEKMLKSPSTAAFDSTSESDGGKWTVTGTVDSENGFGASVRSNYQCTVVINDDNTATTTVDYLK